jgi:hypothetical protein
MDFAKLLAILNDRALFFASGKTLSNSDRLEGQPTYVEIEHLNDNTITERQRGPLGQKTITDFIAIEHQRQPGLASFIENSWFFNCWHLNDSESDAMWKIYAKNVASIAICSTTGRLKSSLSDSRPVFIGKIQYVNFSTDAQEFDIIVRRFMRKNNAFSHEQELRAALYDVHKLNNAGEKVSVDPDRLIEKIVISPTADEWFRGLVESIIQKMGFTFPVVPSEATRVPPLRLLRPLTP